MSGIPFPPAPHSPHLEALRQEVRAFLSEALAGMSARKRAESWSGFDAAFSRKMGNKGWIGMTWSRDYGGHERSPLERYVVLEEVLAAGAPVAAHWIADRQTGPTILNFGTQEQKSALLPAIAAGECFCCIGMSEPGAGSDLAGVRTRAERVGEGYRINGTKIWTTNAHRMHYILLLCRTRPVDSESRHAGMSQLLVDLTTPGITITPVIDMTGEHHFNEITFDNVEVPDSALLGEEGNGWAQVTSELAHERSGPERYLSSFVLLTELVRLLGNDAPVDAREEVGMAAARAIVLRRMSLSVAGMLQTGEDPSLQATIVKDLGADYEQDLPEIARRVCAGPAGPAATPEFADVMDYLLMASRSFSLRGGTREILRGIIARGLGLR